jgi:hypothetical protein
VRRVGFGWLLLQMLEEIGFSDGISGRTRRLGTFVIMAGK